MTAASAASSSSPTTRKTASSARRPPTSKADAVHRDSSLVAVTLAPVKRLRHFLELESPGELARARQIPAVLTDMFMQIGALRQRLDGFLKRQTATASPLSLALLAPEKMSLLENLEQQLAVVNGEQAKLLDELRALDAEWEGQRSHAQIADIAHALSFVTKWGDQLREGVVKLSL